MDATPPLPAAAVEAARRECLAPLERTAGPHAYEVLERLQAVMNEGVGIVRDGPGLEQAIARLEALAHEAAEVRAEGDRPFNPGWNLALDLRNLMLVAEAVARAALERRESRGAHTREDHPEASAEEGRANLVVRKTPRGMEVHRVPLPEWPAEIREIVEEKHG